MYLSLLFFSTQGLLCPLCHQLQPLSSHPQLGPRFTRLTGTKMYPSWKNSHCTVLQCARVEGPFQRSRFRRVINILDSLKLFLFFNLPKYITFIIECLRKIRFCDRKNVKRITEVLISFGNHDLGSRVVVCTQGYYLERWFSKFFCIPP